MNNPSINQLLAESGLILAPDTQQRIERYLELIREWNPVASLVSQGDQERLFDTHVVDSFSLAPVVLAKTGGLVPLIDIGSGAGFPAIPIKLLLPQIPVTLVERSSKKAGFLRKAIAALHLDRVTLLHDEFPRAAAHWPQPPYLITARAVETPPKIMRHLADLLSPECDFLCQFDAPETVFRPEMFHVERWEDAWTHAGYRRGPLHLVRRRP